MKAQDYANIYINRTDDKEAIRDIVTKFIVETGQIIRDRKAKSVTAGLAVISEQSDKWKAMCRRIPGVLKEDGYRLALKTEFPELAPYI